MLSGSLSKNSREDDSDPDKLSLTEAAPSVVAKRTVTPFFVHVNPSMSTAAQFVKSSLVEQKSFAKDERISSINPLLETSSEFQRLAKDFYKMVKSSGDAEAVLEEIIEKDIDILVVDGRQIDIRRKAGDQGI